MSFCLPPSLTETFKAAIKDGTIDPDKLSEMSSEDRRNFFTNIVGDEAKDLNAAFESKLLLKDQQAGIIRWAKSATGITEAAKRDIITKTQNMTEILTPENEKAFLSDLAAKKLGAQVSIDEANQITKLSGAAQDARDALKANPLDKQAQLAYGNKYLDLQEYTNSLKPQPKSNLFVNALNLPKSFLTSIFHFSASFVQGWGMMTTRPFWEAFGNQFKYFADPKAYRDLDASIIGHPDYPLAVDGKLGLTKLGDKLSAREEQIQSSLLEKVPVLNTLVKASSRGFTGFLNYTRFTRFTNLLDAARLNGEDISKGSQAVKDIASVVNDFTGRGALGKDDRYANAQAILNGAFFSPRKIVATMEMFNPAKYVPNQVRDVISKVPGIDFERVSPTAQKAAIRQLGGSLIATYAVIQLAQLAGAKVNMNPTSTNFTKIQFGDTTLDVTGGNSIYLRLLARIATQKYTSSSGKTSTLNSGKFGSQTELGVLGDYFRGKLSPLAGALGDALAGTTLAGYKTSLIGGKGTPFNESEAFNMFVPIVVQDVINLAVNDPHGASSSWPLTLAAFFGVDMETESKK